MPLLADFGSQRVRYAGDSGERWFVSVPADRTFLALSREGEVVDRRTLPAAIDRVADGGGMLVGIDGDSGYDLTLCRRIWRFDGGGRAISRELGIAGDRAFDIRTGEKLWAVEAHDAAVAFDDAFVFLLRPGGDLVARERASGREAWRRAVGRPAPALAVAAGRVSFFTNGNDGRAVIRQLEARTGELAAEHDLRGAVRGMTPTSRGLGLLFESGLDVLLAHGAIEPVIEESAIDVVVAGGDAVAAFSDAKSMLWWMASFDEVRPRRVWLSDSWKTPRLDGGSLTLTSAAGTRLLRFSIDEPPSASATPVHPLGTKDDLEPAEVVFAGPSIVLAHHATRGRFTMHAANTGLAKGATVYLGGFVPGPGNMQFATRLQFSRNGERVSVNLAEHAAARTETIGRVPFEAGGRGRSRKAAAKKKAAAAPTPVRRLIDGLVAEGLIDAMTESAQKKVVRRLFPDGAVGPDGRALLLHYVHGPTGGLARGFLAHDRRFRTETDDVVAELAQALAGEPVSLAQVGERDDALHVRVTMAGRTEEAWVSADGLTPLVAFLNARLEQAGARKRIHALATNDDGWQAFVVR